MGLNSALIPNLRLHLGISAVFGTDLMPTVINSSQVLGLFFEGGRWSKTFFVLKSKIDIDKISIPSEVSNANNLSPQKNIEPLAGWKFLQITEHQVGGSIFGRCLVITL